MTTASDSHETQKKRLIPDFADSFVDTVKHNGNLFTIFAVVLICVSGISIVESPSNWWVSAVAIIVFFLTVFLFMNARVLVKMFVASLLTIIISSFAFSIGSSLDPRGTGGLVWMCGTLFLFFACLALSYLMSSGKSRWGAMIVTQILTFAVVYTVSMGTINVNLGVLVGLIFGFTFFLIQYKLTGASRFSKKGMPENRLTEDMISSMEIGAKSVGMNSVALMDNKAPKGSVLVWSDRAYLLHPVTLKSAFTSIGRRRARLGYQKKNINPWLINLAFTQTPVWKARGADIMLVLVDLENKNGKEPRVIGAALPDTKKKLPVGIIPGRVFNSSNKEALRLAFEALEDEFSVFVQPLNTKQETALSRIGRTHENPEAS